MSIFRPEAIKLEPDEAVYRKRPYKPLHRYLILLKSWSA